MRWSRLVVVLGLATGLSAGLKAQVFSDTYPTPRHAIMKFVSLNEQHKLNTSEARPLLSGEVTRPPPSLGPLAEPDKIVMLSNDTAVARLPALSSTSQDIYVFMISDGRTWTIEAGRRLAIPPFVWQLRDDLSRQQNRTPKNEITLCNLNLTLSTDKELTQWFAKNSGKLEKLRSLVPKNLKPNGPGRRVQSPETDQILEELSASALSIASDGILTVTIGGILDNSVGFLFAPDGRAPSISKSEYIWVEPVSENWFLFKTT